LEVEVTSFPHILKVRSQNISRRRQDAPLPKIPEIKYYEYMMPADPKRDLFEARVPGLNAHMNPEYNQTEWMTYQESFENKDLWTVHEEERIAFEIKTHLAGVEGAGMTGLRHLEQTPIYC
jgi:hypothetical protein